MISKIFLFSFLRLKKNIYIKKIDYIFSYKKILEIYIELHYL